MPTRQVPARPTCSTSASAHGTHTDTRATVARVGSVSKNVQASSTISPQSAHRCPTSRMAARAYQRDKLRGRPEV
jgi:hypothetical protein